MLLVNMTFSEKPLSSHQKVQGNSIASWREFGPFPGPEIRRPACPSMARPFHPGAIDEKEAAFQRQNK
jgi:hypothetical protein